MMIAVFILITALVTFYCFMPLLRPKELWLALEEQGMTRRALEEEKNSYLRAIKDIEFEHASNKINDQDYEELRKDYTLKAAGIIQALEQEEEQEREQEKEQEKGIGRGGEREQEKVAADLDQQGEQVSGDVRKLHDKIDLLSAQLEELQNSMDKGEIDEMDYLDLSDPVSHALKQSRKTLAVLTS